jgi:hypothetical protein
MLAAAVTHSANLMFGTAGLAGTPAQVAPRGTVSPFITCRHDKQRNMEGHLGTMHIWLDTPVLQPAPQSPPYHLPATRQAAAHTQASKHDGNHDVGLVLPYQLDSDCNIAEQGSCQHTRAQLVNAEVTRQCSGTVNSDSDISCSVVWSPGIRHQVA